MPNADLPGRHDGPFGYVDGVLCIDGLPLHRVVEATGTPAYVYSADAVDRAYTGVAAAFAPISGRVLYSVKANANLALLRRLAAAGAGFDVVSGGELERVLRAGADSGDIVFAGVGKTAEELARAVECGVRVHVESADELDALQAAAAAQGRRAAFGIRVNPDVDVDTHPSIRTGHDEAKFGVAVHEAKGLLASVAAGAQPNLEAVAVHVHVGSQLPDGSGMVAGARVGLDVISSARTHGLGVDRLDVGGGLPVGYDGSPALGPAVFAKALGPVLAGTGVRLEVEPGRALVARAGALVARVLYRKHRSAGRMLVLDTGMHHLLRPALYRAHHRVVPLLAAPSAGPTELVGPICESTDVLAVGAELPDLVPGDLVAVLDAGAYGMTMASNYNAQPRPPEIVVSGGSARVTRRRETLDDLLACDNA